MDFLQTIFSREVTPPGNRSGRSLPIDVYEVSCRARTDEVVLHLMAMRPKYSGSPFPPVVAGLDVALLIPIYQF
jgi:hypothetical protein